MAAICYYIDYWINLISRNTIINLLSHLAVFIGTNSGDPRPTQPAAKEEELSMHRRTQLEIGEV